MWPSNVMDDIDKQQGASSIILQALCNISKPSVNSNLRYSPEALNSCQNRRFFVPCDLEIWRMILNNYRALSYAASSFVHHFIAINAFKLELQCGNAQFGGGGGIKNWLVRIAFGILHRESVRWHFASLLYEKYVLKLNERWAGGMDQLESW